MNRPLRNRASHPVDCDGAVSRRRWLGEAAAGFGALALAQMLALDGALGADEQRPGDASSNAPSNANRVDLNGGLHHRAKVRRVVQLFMNGGVSQVDTFDRKPELDKRHGEKIDFGIKAAATSTPGAVMKSPFEWKQHGQCGRWVSSVFPHIATCVDDIGFLMAMASKTNVHGPASYMQNTGFTTPGYPCLGAWLSYGLGQLTDELPKFVVLPDPRGLPYNATGNFSQGFLPAAHQGTLIDPNAPTPIANLHPPKSATQITKESEAAGLDLLKRLNAAHRNERPGDSRLEARIASFELAAKMQAAAPQVLDLSSETAATLEEYGANDPAYAGFGKNCLIARRMLERGVRFVQVWSGMDGASNNWDNHGDIPNQLPAIARTVDKPTAALLKDLKRRGLFEDTLLVFSTEFGRMPFTQGATGRDHNGGAFVTWLAGAGIKGGSTHGTTDDFGYKGADDVTWSYDLHATILHLMGIDHERLSFRNNGVDRRLTDVHGHVVRDILA